MKTDHLFVPRYDDELLVLFYNDEKVVSVILRKMCRLEESGVHRRIILESTRYVRKVMRLIRENSFN